MAKRRVRSLASSADPFDLYQRSVQAPEEDLAFFERAFRRHFRRRPMLLREDFCGTAYLSTEWARSHPGRRAVAVDHDERPLAWGRAHNLAPAGRGVARRVRLVGADVRQRTPPAADLVCALNFSFCVFKRRRELADYLRVAFKSLRREGLFVCELYGGTEAMIDLVETRRVDSRVTYEWEQERFDPLGHETVCHIHFRFRDGSRLDRAFTYDWRLWTVPEMRELLAEAGFAALEIYWETVDEDGDPTGVYRLTRREENQEGWLVYLVGVKKPGRG